MTDTTADLYQRAKSIACAALDRAADDRLAFIAVGCGDDKALRLEVLWLIEAAESTASDAVPEHLTRAAQQMVASINVDAPLPRNYRVLTVLGQGGMGVVYLAERTDGDLGQRVALKLLHAGDASDAALARGFDAEQRILAGLSHPNIAHLVDAGVTAQGRPFLAMEYVDGERIDQWCKTHELTLKARIDLFLKVCAAVDYAHRHLVIHRDIKPANILVTHDGEPKLLDFGIARWLPADDESALQTETGLRALTLAYASPEQIEGRPLSTATDVYSLGVVLYQLLTGARPFDHLESAHHLSNAIVSGEITPPSRQLRRRVRENPLPSDPAASIADTGAETPPPRTDATTPPRRVPADVDAIVLKALRREPAQRYASVAELAADLRCFLESRPVLARRGHWPYRARRFAWRWRWTLAAATAFAALLGGFLFDREAQLERVARERDSAKALVDFMNDLFENADSLRSRGNQVTIREMLDRGAVQLQARKDLDPVQRSSMLFAMGRAYNGLGQGQQALPLLKSAQALLAPAVGSAEERAAVLDELAAAYSTSRNTGASIAADAQAIELLRTADGDHADQIARLQLRELQNHANLLDIPLEQTRARLQAILTDLEAREEPPDALLVLAYRALTVAWSDQSDGRQAIEMAEKARTIATRLYGPDDPRILPTRFAYAMAMQHADADQAIGLYRALVADYERLVGPGLNLASVLNNLGNLLSQSGRTEEGAAVYQRAADIALKAAGPEHWTYLTAISNLANLYKENGNPEQAQALIQSVLPTLAADAASAAGMDPGSYVAALDTLAATLSQQGKMEGAEQTYRKAEQVLAAVDAGAYPELRAQIHAGLIASQRKRPRSTQ